MLSTAGLFLNVAREGKIYVNYLKILCKENLSLLSRFFIQLLIYISLDLGITNYF